MITTTNNKKGLVNR